MTSSLDGPTYGRIFTLAWPAAVAASITPLLGMIDVWALGNSSRPLDIAAVGLAATIFSLAYWTFGFLRMSTAGLTAQAAGANDHTEVRLGVVRALILGGSIGLLLVIVQWPLGQAAFRLLAIGSEASESTFASARAYFDIRIWGAPFALATYGSLGWLTARGRTDYLMVTAILMTAVNVALDLTFVLVFDFGASGIAAGTLIAECIGFLVSIGLVLLVLKREGRLRARITQAELFDHVKLKQMVSVNSDIFIRTLILAFSFAWFAQRGSAFGDVTLAANQTLLQLFLMSGLALDGTAIAAETLVGQSLGRVQGMVARDSAREDTSAGTRDGDNPRHYDITQLAEVQRNALNEYDRIVRRSFILAVAAAAIFSVIYILFGKDVLGLLLPSGVIFDRAWIFWPWIIISPMIVMVCFQLDGIFVGATRSREMRNSMIVAAGIFLPLSLLLPSYIGNHGLWLAFSVYFLIRAMGLWVYMPRIRNSFSLG